MKIQSKEAYVVGALVHCIIDDKLYRVLSSERISLMDEYKYGITLEIARKQG